MILLKYCGTMSTQVGGILFIHIRFVLVAKIE